MFDDIVQDWERWVASPRARRKLGDWGRRHPAAAGWRADELRSPTSSERTDSLQAALVALAQSGDEDAVRTLIVQLRPGLVGLVWRGRRSARWDLGASPLREAQREVLSAFGETLSSHRLDRRPARIAANLLLDTRQRLWRAAQRERRLTAIAVPVDHAHGHQPGASDGALDLVAAIEAAIEGLAAASDGQRLTAELAYRAWILDEPSAAIARELGLRRNTVDTRLCRLRSVLRSTRPPDDDAQRVTRRSDGSTPPSSPVGPSCVSRQ